MLLCHPTFPLHCSASLPVALAVTSMPKVSQLQHINIEYTTWKIVQYTAHIPSIVYIYIHIVYAETLANVSVWNSHSIYNTHRPPLAYATASRWLPFNSMCQVHWKSLFAWQLQCSCYTWGRGMVRFLTFEKGSSACPGEERVGVATIEIGI